MTIQKVSAWGNSLGIRLPQAIAQQVGFTEGVSVSLAIEGNKLILAPAKPSYNLDDLLAGVEPDMQHDEVDWGESVGAEAW